MAPDFCTSARAIFGSVAWNINTSLFFESIVNATVASACGGGVATGAVAVTFLDAVICNPVTEPSRQPVAVIFFEVKAALNMISVESNFET